MLGISLQSLYALPKLQLLIIVSTGMLAWMLIGFLNKREIRDTANYLLFCFGFFIIVFLTILCRNKSDFKVLLEPSIMFWKDTYRHDLYRDFFLNILLFIPFSLGLAGALPEKIRLRKRMIIVILSGFVLSVSVEVLQFIFSLGNTEMDDVIMNTLGSVIAALALLIQDKLCKLKNKKSKAGD